MSAGRGVGKRQGQGGQERERDLAEAVANVTQPRRHGLRPHHLQDNHMSSKNITRQSKRHGLGRLGQDDLATIGKAKVGLVCEPGRRALLSYLDA